MTTEFGFTRLDKPEKGGQLALDYPPLNFIGSSH